MNVKNNGFVAHTQGQIKGGATGAIAPGHPL